MKRVLKLKGELRLYLKSRHLYDFNLSPEEIARYKVGRREWIRNQVSKIRGVGKGKGRA